MRKPPRITEKTHPWQSRLVVHDTGEVLASARHKTLKTALAGVDRYRTQGNLESGPYNDFVVHVLNPDGEVVATFEEMVVAHHTLRRREFPAGVWHDDGIVVRSSKVQWWRVA